MPVIEKNAKAFQQTKDASVDAHARQESSPISCEVWQAAADLKTYRQAVADVIEFRSSQGESIEMSVEEWLAFSKRASWYAAREKAKSMGISIAWDCELAKTPDGYYQVQGGLDYAIAKSLAAAPFADILWMETNTANLAGGQESSPKRSTPSSRTKCSPTICRRPSTGTPPA